MSTVTRETVTIDEAARRLGISRSLAYRLARRDELPVPVLRIGRRLVVPVAALDAILGSARAGERRPR